MDIKKEKKDDWVKSQYQKGFLYSFTFKLRIHSLTRCHLNLFTALSLMHYKEMPDNPRNQQHSRLKLFKW